jgi:hypothetical protein
VFLGRGGGGGGDAERAVDGAGEGEREADDVRGVGVEQFVGQAVGERVDEGGRGGEPPGGSGRRTAH